MDIVTGIPDLIERVIQCARLIKDASNINSSIDFDLQHGQHVAHQLILMGDIIKRSEYFPSTSQRIVEALLRAEQSAGEFLAKLDELRGRSGLTDKANDALTTTHETLPKNDLNEKMEKSSDATNDSPWWSCLSFNFAKLKNICCAGMEKVRRKSKLPGKGAVVMAFNRVQYLVLIERDVKAALKRMDQAHMDLFNLMFIAPLHNQIIGDENAQEFIRNAEERLKDDRPLERIDIPQDFLRPIDNRLKVTDFKIKRPYTLFLVTDGTYAGCLVDRRDISHLRRKGLEKTAHDDTSRLARLLRRQITSKDGHTDEKIAVLRCRGVSFPTTDLHDLVLQLPPGFSSPRTLRMVLLDEQCINHARNARIELALQLCNAVHVLHSLDIVHKGVRPENILLLPPLPDSSDDSDGRAYITTLGKPYLAGFCYSRSDNSQSGMDRPYEAIFAEIIYHHPRHLERQRNYQFDKADDIYSLGICLLEIGLWRSLLHWSEEEDWYVVGEDWQLQGTQYEGLDGYNASDAWYRRKGRLISIARDCLPVQMTSAYANLVVSCLKFGDEKRSNRHADADFIGSVLAKLLSMTRSC